MTSITITVPVPSPKLSPNARTHFMVKSKLTKSARSTASAIAKAEIGLRDAPMWLKARANVVCYFKTISHPDPDNVIARLKATFDGIADAGIVANDKGLWPERPVLLKDAKNPRIEITVTAEG